jgi:AcrR family transcriptional regulator
MKYFIEAAEEIVETEGIQAVTIRKVSDMAGYTSATLYNYFDDLNHLIFFVAMRYLETYREEQARAAQGLSDPKEIYYKILSVFTKHALTYPDIFEVLYVAARSKKSAVYVKQYYELFPERLPQNVDRDEWAVFVMSLSKQNNLNYLEPLVQHGSLTREEADELADYTVIILAYYLTEAVTGSMEMEAARERSDFYIRKLTDLLIEQHCADCVTEEKV